MPLHSVHYTFNTLYPCHPTPCSFSFHLSSHPLCRVVTPFSISTFFQRPLPLWFEIAYVKNLYLTLTNIDLDPLTPLFGGPVDVTRMKLRTCLPVELNAEMMQYAYGSLTSLCVGSQKRRLHQVTSLPP